MMVSATRLYRFSASHRLHSDQLTGEENRQLYGKCNNPFGHGHDYVLEITCSGPVDARTGMVVLPRVLDRLISAKILRRLSCRNINVDVPEFRSRVATTENLTLFIAEQLQQVWCEAMPAALRLTRVQIQETPRNGFELLLAGDSANMETTIHA